MEFQAKYASTEEMEKPENKSKIVLTDEAYAIGEMLQALIDKIEHARMSLMK